MCWRDSLSNREWNLQCGGELGRWLVERGDEIRAERVRKLTAEHRARIAAEAAQSILQSVDP